MTTQIISKRCSTCKQNKPLVEFHTRPDSPSGYRGQCKICQRKQNRYWYKNSDDAQKKHRENDHRQSKTKEGRIASSKKQAKYRKTPNGQQTGKQYAFEYKSIYPQRIKAKSAINNAIRRGDILSPKLLTCTYCTNKAMVYHHASYEPEKWFVVIPVCKLCHSSVHRKLSLSG